jgi:oxygen-independent coproporphyrinogen III oxidase
MRTGGRLERHGRRVCAHRGPGAGTRLDVTSLVSDVSDVSGVSGATDSPDLASCIAEHSRRGPRYTSYPPATELGPIAVDRVRRELAAIASAGETVSLYVHVPFCRSLCAYCGCNVVPTRDAMRGIAYVDQLATELALLAGPLGEARVTELALGGGSPNFLAPRTLRTLMGAIDRYLHVEPDARRSVELDPRTTTTAQLEALADTGFRALSLGVQDFAEEVQDAIRRHQSVVQTRWLVERARASGFDDVNIDVVYGLPRQTEHSFAATLDAVIALAPDRVAVFGYAHLPAKLPHQRIVERAGRVLDPYERATLLLLAIERFAAAGYVHLGLDHFARPGSRLARAAAEQRMVRTFQGYVERRADAILGAGASAISSTPRMIWQNHAELAAWEAAIAARQLPVARGFVLDEDDRARAALIERLMCDGAVDLARLGREHALEPEAYFAAELAELARLGELARYDPARRAIETTPIGRLLVRNVCMVFDRYHRPADGEPRFSSTI